MTTTFDGVGNRALRALAAAAAPTAPIVVRRAEPRDAPQLARLGASPSDRRETLVAETQERILAMMPLDGSPIVVPGAPGAFGLALLLRRCAERAAQGSSGNR